jgi:hypothetical protein
MADLTSAKGTKGTGAAPSEIASRVMAGLLLDPNRPHETGSANACQSCLGAVVIPRAIGSADAQP